MPRHMLFTVAMLGFATAAHASSDEAWEEFRAEVETACTAVIEAPEDAVVTAEVNPFGSQSYGVALMTVAAAPAAEAAEATEGAEEPMPAAERMVCIFDKTAKTVEITGPFIEPDPVEDAEPQTGG